MNIPENLLYTKDHEWVNYDSNSKIAIVGITDFAQKELGDIVIYDIPNAEGMIKGKALDISQLTPMDGYDCNITGSSNPEDLKDSDVIIITAGILLQKCYNYILLINKFTQQLVDAHKLIFQVTNEPHLLKTCFHPIHQVPHNIFQ